MPESDPGKRAFRVRDDPHIDFLEGIDAGHPELHSVEGYLSTGVGGSRVSETEGTIEGFIGEGKLRTEAFHHGVRFGS